MLFVWGDYLTNKFYRWLLDLIAKDNMIPFYKSKQWRTLRAKALKRDHYECVLCKAEGKYHRAQNVHHIQEVKARPDLALSLENIECICIRHHNAIHDRYQPVVHVKPEDRFNNFDASERW